MAVPAKKDATEQNDGFARLDPETQKAVLHAARLFGLGHSRKEICRVLAEELYGQHSWRTEDKVRAARARVRRWETKQWFRDLVWDAAVVELDMSSGQILRGVKNKAIRGRVDAAKLALAVTGRHNEKDQAVPAAVTINLVGISRPMRTEARENEAVGLGEIVDED
jgi:hypothetical protein